MSADNNKQDVSAVQTDNVADGIDSAVPDSTPDEPVREHLVDSTEEFDWQCALTGPANLHELSDMMRERKIANDESLEFDEDFVDRFYEDSEHEQGVEAMYNGEPSIWGRVVWDSIHLYTYYFPSTPSADVRRAAYQFVQSLRYMLPCENCRAGFRKELLQLPVEEFLDSRESFIEWGIQLHSSVNERLGQPPCDVDKIFARLLEKPEKKPSEAKQASAKKTVAKRVTPALSGNSVHAQQQLQRQQQQQQKQETRNAAKNSAVSSGKTVTTQSYRQKAAPTSRESLQSVREAFRRNLNNRQRASLANHSRAQKANAAAVKKPAECKSCGKSRPLVSSKF